MPGSAAGSGFAPIARPPRPVWFGIALGLEFKPVAVPNEVQGGHKTLLKLRVGGHQAASGSYAVAMSRDWSCLSSSVKQADVRNAAWSGGVTFEGPASSGEGGAGSGGAGIRAPCGV
jgi:hypothetical protein